MSSKFAKIYIFGIYIYLAATEALARAGGGGGGSGNGNGSRSGGGGGHTYSGGVSNYRSSGYSSSGGSTLGSFWTLIIILIILYVLYKRFGNRVNQNLPRSNGSGVAPSIPVTASSPLSLEEESALIRKSYKAFETIQTAWSLKSSAPMRRFISDGIYQRFNAQFLMMNQLDQTNVISNLQVLNAKMANYSLDGDYESVDIAIYASAFDQFSSRKFPQFNSPGGQEEFSEVWSFIRRKNRVQISDIFSQNVCPKCSGPLGEKLQETARCPYCGVSINSGEFDWVLSEITQSNDYSGPTLVTEEMNQTLTQVRSMDAGFSIQVVEDRTSNAFLQVLIGHALNDQSRLAKFATKNGEQSVLTAMSSQVPAIYNRIYLSSVELTRLSIDANQLATASVSITCYAQRVQIVGQDARLLDHDVVPQSCTVSMIHKIKSQAAKGSIYANSCPQCGAPQKDTLLVQCEFCGAACNDPAGDWILDGFAWDRHS